MKALAILVALTGIASAESRSITDARGFLKAMTEASAPAYAAKHPVVYTVKSDQPECAKLAAGKASSPAELAALKTCFVATSNHIAKEAVLDARDLKSKDLDGRQLKFSRAAPKGTSWVRATRSYAGQNLEITMAIGADHAVLAVWFTYLESDGE